jgi:hypothetical protein
LDTLLGPEETGLQPPDMSRFGGCVRGLGFFLKGLLLSLVVLVVGVQAGTVPASNVIFWPLFLGVGWVVVVCVGWCCLFFENCTVDASIFVSLIDSILTLSGWVF